MSKQDLKWIIDNIIRNNVSDFKPHAQIRNASVAAIIRWRPYILDNIIIQQSLPTSALDLLNQSWVNDCHGQAEILFIQRALRPGDFWSGHVAFPGGKNEMIDKTNLDTVTRECQEEIGVDLSSAEFIHLGTLKHRNINRSDKVLMTLVPHVFLQVTPITPKFTIQPKEVAETHWISIHYLLQNPIIVYNPMMDFVEPPITPWSTSIRVPAIPLVSSNTTINVLHLWGMTLRMTQEILGMEVSHTIMSTEEIEKYEKKSSFSSKL